MSKRPAPWQFEWKRPEWQSPADDESNFSVDGVPVSTAAAQISSAEIQEWEKRADQDTFSVAPDTEDEEISLLLTATLYSTGKPNTASADVLLLELIEHKRSGAKRLKHRMLRWPGSTINDDEEQQQEEKSWNISSWIGKRPKRVGLVSVTLCRLPVGEELAAASVDAMDVVALLSLGLDATESTAEPNAQTVEVTTEAEPQPRSVEPTDLIMACLTTDGRVLLYSPQKIFRPDASKYDKQELEDGLALLLLGNAIHQQLEQTVLPLSQPLAVVPLSVPLKKSKKPTKAKHDNLDVIPEDLVLPEDHDEVHEEDAAIEQDLWEGSFWDANIEASTAKYHTIENVPKLMVPAFDFIAVAGQGTRVRRIKRRNSSSSRGSSVSSWEIASHDEEKWELSAKTRSNTADSAESGGWWEENQVEAPLDDETSNSTKRKEKAKTKWVEYKETGGFITFISLRYYAEFRTVYLPFAPKHLSAVVWGDMHFLIVLGEESMAPLHTPLAMAVRVDSFDVISVPRGEAPSYSRDNSEDTDTSKTSFEDKGATHGDKKKAKRKAMCTVRRFHLIPIILPSRGSSSSEEVTAVAVSSTLTEPPAIALQYSSQPEMSGDLLVTLNSLQSLDIVPTILTHRAMGGYRRFGKEAERAFAIKTHATAWPRRSYPLQCRTINYKEHLVSRRSSKYR